MPSHGGGVDRTLDTHKTLRKWHTDGSNSNNVFDIGEHDNGRGGFKRRDFDPKQGDVGFPGPMMEQSNSLQSLVESIKDDDVLKLTEMTKKRVEHNNPTQKRQRVVSLPTSEASQANFQPSENTLQFSSSCKAYLESKYTQLYQSINAGHPINRLRRLHEIHPQIQQLSIPKPAHDNKNSVESALPRPRWRKNDKYRFVDKVEESSCIWDVDHMEKVTAQAAAAEAAALAKQVATPNSRQGSQHNLVQAGSTSKDSSLHQLPSSSTENLGAEGSVQYNSSPLAAVDAQNTPVGMSPSSTLSSIISPANSTTTLDQSIQKRTQNENSGESKLRFADPYPPASKSTSAPTIKLRDGGGKNAINSLDSPNAEGLHSKRNSFLGIFGVRGKKVGQDSDQLDHYESLQSSSYSGHRPTATGPIQERRSFDSQLNSYFPTPITPVQTHQSQLSLEVAHPLLTGSPSTYTTSINSSGSQSKRNASYDEAVRTAKCNEINGVASIDDDNGGHFGPASQWPQGERIEESQDESDNPAADKRSSLRRLKDRMTWKRGHKALSTIQQNETYQGAFVNSAQGKTTLQDGTKSLGKKADPSLAHLHDQYTVRASMSEPSSGRNSIEISSRPKASFSRALSGASSPILEAVRNPDGVIGLGSPRFGPSAGVSDATTRLEKSPIVHPTKGDRSPMANPVPWMDKSPALNPSRMDKQATTGAGEDQNICTTSELLVDVDRIPKRLLERLKLRPELASVNWSEDTVDLSPMWTAAEPVPTYYEYLGISNDMKLSKDYPSHLDDIDVMEIHLTIGVDELNDINAKSRVRKWDELEQRLDIEISNGEKWFEDLAEWSEVKMISIEKHKRQETSHSDGVGYRVLDGNMPLVEEPEAEDDMEEGEESSVDNSNSDTATSMATLERGNGMGRTLKPFIPPPRVNNIRKKQRDLSLLSVRDLNAGGSISLPHHNSTSVSYTFRASLDSTREAIKEMRVHLMECRERLKQLDGATRLLKKESDFKEIVDTFAREWNDSYFVKLKEVEDQIQVMNLKRIENPWVDMLLIMLSWFIRGLFYIVEGVTIMIIIVRHAWGKAKRGYEVIRNARREQERVSHGSGGARTIEETAGIQNTKSNTTEKTLTHV
ncbi:hypothetical protein BGZ80_011505 [Entomortierella chlamydospora]|uniref:Uncharacterized protein n=1 Tax=Entomortierella chlamydospora TaxID=101097 RepID=A0A9P6MTI4_9FUNG|nr:hypothetical protein BGZ80_011505 [Entomortierella chlamydospora]